jgi:flagellar biosynthesis protein
MDKDDKAVALGYSGKDVPKILAIARGRLVKKLLEIAEDNNITIYRDSDLAEVLSTLDIGSEIPEDLFHAVAAVLAYCYRVNLKFKEKIESSDK